MSAGGKRFPVGELKRLVAEVDGDDRAVRESALLDLAVGGEDAVSRHLAITSSAGDWRSHAIALHEPIPFVGPLAVYDNVHAHRTVEDVEEVALPPDVRELGVVVAPVPLGADAVVVNELPQG